MGGGDDRNGWAGFEGLLLGGPGVWLPSERERVEGAEAVGTSWWPLPSQYPQPDSLMSRDEEDAGRAEKAQVSPRTGKMSSPFLQLAQNPTAPTYKQGILARKMHHDADGKKSECLLPCCVESLCLPPNPRVCACGRAEWLGTGPRADVWAGVQKDGTGQGQAACVPSLMVTMCWAPARTPGGGGAETRQA